MILPFFVCHIPFLAFVRENLSKAVQRFEINQIEAEKKEKPKMVPDGYYKAKWESGDVSTEFQVLKGKYTLHDKEYELHYDDDFL